MSRAHWNLIQIQPHLVRLFPKSAPLHICQGRTVIAADMDGVITEGAEVGLFVHETRMLSRWRYLINEMPPLPIVLSNVQQHSWLGYYIFLPREAPTGEPDYGSGVMQPITEQSLELRVSRFVGEGFHEDVDLTNYTSATARFTLAIEVDADFADLEETRRKRQQHGELKRDWRRIDDGRWELDFDYQARHRYRHQGDSGTARIHRGLTVRVCEAGSPPTYADGRLSFEIELKPHESWHVCFDLMARVESGPLALQYHCHDFQAADNEYERKRRDFLDTTTAFRGPGSGTLTSSVIRTLEQSKRDLASMRLYDLDRGDHAWTVAAGLPIYVALFGRDVLTAAWQSGLIGVDLLRGSLETLAGLQGTTHDDWRDEQPGRMPHEVHSGPLASLNYVPFGRYYGSMTASAFFPVALAELWHWTGDRGLVEPLVEPALAALDWLDNDGDLDGDGFYEYQTRSSQGVVNQAWKDSPDAMVDERGRVVDTPIAACETQAFAFGAKLHFAEVLWWLDRHDEAKRLFHEAMELRKRFNEVFWLEDEQFYAMALGPDKRPIRSIASNPAHCLAAGLIDDDRIQIVADRLMSPELFSGWGIRTLSEKHPAYNPYSYHRGSVWPAAQGTFALGFYRYGLHEYAERICRALYESAMLFDFNRLPEVIGGHPRDREHPFPALYPQANAPQAWSSSSSYVALQSILGLYPYAPLKMLLVDPHLPEWLPEITLEHLRVGDAAATIRFFRHPDGRGDYEVLEREGSLHVLRQPSPQSMTATTGERLRDALSSLLPGK